MAVKVKVYNPKNIQLPEYATPGSACADIRSAEDYKEIRPHERELFDTGLYVAFPVGYILEIRPKSGLAFKYGVTVLNAPGTVDSDYPKSIGVLLINHGEYTTKFTKGQEIAQIAMVGSKGLEHIEWEPVDSIEELNAYRQQLQDEWLSQHPDFKATDTMRKGGWGSTYQKETH